jgi:NTE family protein
VSVRESARVAPSAVLLVAGLGAFLAFLDATIVNVAFPSIRASFPGSSIGSLSWVLNAYNIVFAAFLVVCGRLADLIGRRRSYAGGIALFTLASCWCAAAPNVELLVAGRVLQALGSAMLVPASLALVVEAFPEERRAHAIGLWGAAAAAAAGLGPPIGGALVELGGWRWAFLVNLPVGALALVASRRTLVESRSPGRRRLPDLPGALLLAAGLALVNLAIIEAPDWGWGSPRVLGSFLVAGLLAAAFVRSSLRHPAPVVDPALLRISSFRVASIATVLAGLGFYAYLLTNILWLRYVWDYDVLRAGLALVPGAVVAALVAARLGPLAERVGYRVLVVPGALVWAGAYLWYHQQVGLSPAFWSQWLPGQILSGVGVGATLPLLGSAALAAVPGGRYATASALVSSARQLGGVLGISVLVVIVGTPTPATVVGSLRDGWLLSIGAFVLTACVATLLARPRTSAEVTEENGAAPLVLPVERPPEPARTGPRAAVSLEDLPLLDGLPASALSDLATATRTVEVRAGEWLFREGDAPGSAYVLAGGRLQIVQEGAVVRELAPGAVLGELALLTGEPRSAGARAHRDATLLELPREAFESVLDDHPRAARTLLVQVAGQLRTTSANTAQGRAVAPHVVAVVGLHPASAAREVADVLIQRIGDRLTVADPGLVDAAGLARAEHEHDRVVLVADGPMPSNDADAGWWDFCVRQADLVVLVAASDLPVPEVVQGAVEGPEVVLVGPTPDAARLSAWTATTDAWQLTSVGVDLHGDLRPLADRIASRSLGLVLAGGGARAFAHVGVLLELEEAGYHVDRLAGTSLGAIVAAEYALGRTAVELEELCYLEFVRRRPFSDWTIPKHSLARGARTQAGLVRTLGADTVLEGLPRQLQVVSTDLLSRTRQLHRRGSLVDAVVASCRLPILFPPVPTEDGRLLVDGGVLDNLPVDVLMARDEGPVVAVNISMGGSGRSSGRTGPPRVPPLGDTLFRTMMIGAGGAVQAAHEQGAFVVTPAPMGVGLLEFHQFDVMVRAGREAARALLADGQLVDRTTGGPSLPLTEPEVKPRTVPVGVG